MKKIKGKRNDYYCIRLGGYRIVYALIHGRIVVISTLLADSHGDIYKKMDGLKQSSNEEKIRLQTGSDMACLFSGLCVCFRVRGDLSKPGM